MKVLVDAAQSFGATYKGHTVGSLGDITTTSFFPAKPLGCYGDGGAIFTNNEEDAEIINSIRLHGKGTQKYDNVRIGLNSRLDSIQAAILIEKLKIFPHELKSRSLIATRYNEKLSDYFEVPYLTPQCTSSWAQYTLKVDNRDYLQRELKNLGIPSVIYYPIPLSSQIGYDSYPTSSKGLTVSERLAKRVLSLPMHPYLNTKSQQNIIDSILSLT